MIIVALGSAAFALSASCQGYTVWLRVELQPARGTAERSNHESKRLEQAMGGSPVVAWLTPVVAVPGLSALSSHSASSAHHFVLAQKDKQFLPHVLVVPTGSAVEFPNLDPFFHNVFSLFNGRRFDLGLYEAGDRRTVRFDHEGISYIFCNIHPEMGAVIISLGTPFYATAVNDPLLTIANVPPGDYRLHLWAEDVSTANLSAATQTVHVSQDVRLKPIKIMKSEVPLKRHLNKFGEEYKKGESSPY
jgi:plastocyanin